MRRSLAAAAIALALTGTVATAAPAAAGSGSGSGTVVCGIDLERRNVGGTGPTSDCSPRQVLRVLEKLGVIQVSNACIRQVPTSIDGLRNVGGTVPVPDRCPTWLQNLLVDLGRNIGG